MEQESNLINKKYDDKDSHDFYLHKNFHCPIIGKNVYLFGNFEKELTEMTPVIGVEGNAVVLSLTEGTYYYKFIVDGKEHLDKTCEIVKIEDIYWNKLVISNPISNNTDDKLSYLLQVYETENNNKFTSQEPEKIEDNSSENSNETLTNNFQHAVVDKKKMKTGLLSHEFNFSSKSFKQKSENKTSNFEIRKQYCFYLENEYLEPFDLIQENEEGLHLKMCKNLKSLIIQNYEDLNFQDFSRESEIGYEDLLSINNINELSLMRNIYKRMNKENFRHFCIINDIFMFFNQKNIKKSKFIRYLNIYNELKYFIHTWLNLKIDNDKINNLIILKDDNFIYEDEYLEEDLKLNENENLLQEKIFENNSTIKNLNKNSLFQFNYSLHMVQEIIKSNNLDIYLKCRSLIEIIFQIIKFHFEFDFILLTIFDKEKFHLKFNIIPMFSENYIKVYKNENIKVISDLKIEKVRNLLNLNNFEFYTKYRIFTDLVINNNFELLKLLYESLQMVSLENYFKALFNLLILKELILNPNEILQEFKLPSPDQGICMNLIISCLLKFFLDLINKELLINLSRENKNLMRIMSVFYGDTSDKNTFKKSFNECIYNKVISHERVNSSIFQFIKNNHNLFTQKLDASVNIFFEYFEKKLDFSDIVKFYNKNENESVVKIMIQNLLESKIEIEDIESQKCLIKQLNHMNFSHNLLDKKTISKKFSYSQISESISNHHLLKYTEFYRNYYFAEFSFKEFFRNFFSIIKIDLSSFNEKNDYSASISTFFNILASSEKIEEKFSISSNKIKIGFLLFSILFHSNKLKMSKKVFLVQNAFRSFYYSKLFKLKRNSVLTIQKYFRLFFYKNSINRKRTSFYQYLIRSLKDEHKYLTNLLMKAFINPIKNEDVMILKQQIITLQEENERIHNELKLKNYSVSFESSQKNIFDNISMNSATKSIIKNSSKAVIEIENNKNSQMKDNFSEVNEKEQKYKRKYKEVIQVVKEHEQKFEKLITMLTKNKEIRSVLIKNGIKFN